MIKSKLIKTFSIIVIFCAILTTITFFGCKDNDYPEAGPKIVSVDGGTIDGNNILIIVDNSVTAVSLADKIVSEDGSTWSLCTNVRNEIANKIATFDNGLKLGDNKFYVLVTKDGFSSIYTLTVHRRCEVEVRYLFGSKTLKTEDKESYREYPIDYVPEIDGYTFNYWQDNDGNPIDKFVTTNEPLTIIANTTVIPYALTIDTDNNTHGSVSITILDKQDKINDEEGKFLGYRYGAKIRLTAYQHASCNFIGWFDEEDNFMSSVPEIEFNLYTNTNIKAKFEPQPVLLDYEYTTTRTSCTIDGVKDKTITTLVIPNVFTDIASDAFSDCDNLQSIVMGDTIVGISAGAFRGAKSLTSVTLGKNITSLSAFMFQDCYSLAEFVVPEHINYIGYGAFYGCVNLRSITMGDHVLGIAQFAFKDCTKLADITLSTKISTISKGMFQNCDSIVEYVVPNNINRIDAEAFSECDNLYSFTMGDNVTRIDRELFRNCISLTDITLSTKLSTITQGMFQNCDSLVEYVVPDHIKSIDFEAFSDCDNLYSFTMGDNVTNIGTGVFRHCRSLVDIKLSNSITIINYDTFQGCSGLVEFVIPDNITTIRKEAFAGCANLRRLTVGKNVQTIEIDSFKNCKKVLEICNKSSLNLLYNDGMSEIARKALNVYSPELEVSKLLYDKYGFIYYIDNGTYYMCGYKNTFNSTKLILPDSIDGNVYYVMDGVFNYCNSIREIVIPDTLTEFNKNAFHFCTNLVKVTIGSNVTNIEGTLLHSNKLIEVYNRSKYLIQAGNGINSLSKSVKNVYTPTKGSSKLVYENGFIFYNDNGNYSLISTENVVSSKLYLPQSVNGATYTIADNAFYEESRLSELIITNGVTAIGNNAFYYSGLKTVILGDDLVSIGDEAFALCYNIERVVFGNSLKSIGNYAFSKCDELTKLVFPSSLVSIGEHAFDTANILGISNSLVEVYIPKNVTQIGTSAFDGCSEDIVYYVEAETIPDTWSVFWHGGYPINAVLGSEMPTEN